MAVIEIAKIQVRRGQELQTGIPQLDPGEFGWAQDTQHLYIGKRIIEGANTDENTRILTQPDLENIFNLINSTSSNILKYQYRDQVVYIQDTVVRTVSDKLDDASPSLCDFGVVTSSTAVDISLQFQDAVDNIFGNLTASSFERKDSRRVLRIPAGEYFVSTAIELPPYTILQGEGTGLTRITVINSSTGIFKTVDADKDDWNTGNMDSGVDRSRNVEIRGMTLEYAVTATSNNPLISLDNVLNAIVEDVEFRTAIDTASTTTYGLVSHGIGLSIRGSGGGIGAGDANLCENIQVRNSRFDSLLTGIEGTGTIVRPLIANSIFNNLDRGVKLLSVDSTLGPSNGYLLENRFQNIVKEAIFVGTQTNHGNHISENNFFIQVGNGTTLDDTTTTTASSVIVFHSPGNKSINDHFERKITADTTADPNFYYNPLVSGYVLIVNDTVHYKSAPSGNQPLSKLALVNADQSIDINYKLYKSDHSYTRTGKLLVNISSATTSTVVSGSISDYYNFSYADEWPHGDPDYALFDITTSSYGYAQLNFNNWTGETLNIEYQVNKTA